MNTQSFYIQRLDVRRGNPAPQDVPDTTLPAIGFVYLTEGEMLFEDKGESILCSPGHLMLIPPGRTFSIPYYDGCKGFRGYFAESILPDPVSLHVLNNVCIKAFWFDDAVFVGELFNMLTAAAQAGNMRLISKGIDLLLSMVNIRGGWTGSPLVSSFMKHLFDKEDTPLTPGEYAAKNNVSLNWLNRNVKAGTGKSVGDWIGIARIRMAKKLLRDTDLPIIDVASRAGLSDQAYFTRFFKRSCGMTPSAFRKLYRHG